MINDLESELDPGENDSTFSKKRTAFVLYRVRSRDLFLETFLGCTLGNSRRILGELGTLRSRARKIPFHFIPKETRSSVPGCEIIQSALPRSEGTPKLPRI